MVPHDLITALKAKRQRAVEAGGGGCGGLVGARAGQGFVPMEAGELRFRAGSLKASVMWAIRSPSGFLSMAEANFVVAIS